MSNLAASISSHISSSQTVYALENSDGEAYQRVEQQILETVNQSVREVEIVDSYYSDADGTWIYMRLNKVSWERIQKNEIASLRDRVEGIIRAAPNDGEAAVASQMQSLWSAWTTLIESPYAGAVRGKIERQDGILVDLLENQIVRQIEGLTIALEQSEIACEYGRSVEFAVQVGTGGGQSPGSIPLAITLTGASEENVAGIVTSKAGEFIGPLLLPDLPVGGYGLRVAVDFSQIGVDLGRLRTPVGIPQATGVLTVRPVSVSMVVLAGDTAAADDIFHSLAGLLSGDLPIAIEAERPETRYTIEIAVDFRNAPANDYGLIVTHARAQVRVIERETVIFAFESPDFKDGGLTADQAHTRALDKLLKGLEDDRVFLSDLKKVFLLD